MSLSSDYVIWLYLDHHAVLYVCSYFTRTYVIMVWLLVGICQGISISLMGNRNDVKKTANTPSKLLQCSIKKTEMMCTKEKQNSIAHRPNVATSAHFLKYPQFVLVLIISLSYFSDTFPLTFNALQSSLLDIQATRTWDYAECSLSILIIFSY